MSDEPAAAKELWGVIQDIQEVRRRESIHGIRERKLRTAIRELDAVRKEIKSEASDDE